ncbi:MAG: hypothetical protein Fur0022_13430 [Anaerolineales bacterium]
MRQVYVDTSAFLALLDADEKNHPSASQIWRDLISSNAFLICNNYVIVETFALVQNRLGMNAVYDLYHGLLASVEIIWTDESTFLTGVNIMLSANRKKLSIVDCTSFETMRRLGIKNAFTLDHHFAEQGFDIIP